MKPKTKAILLLALAALLAFGLACGAVLLKYKVNKERFPDAAPWTWWL